MRPVLNFLFRVQKLAWKVFRPRTRGVKVMLFNPAGEILLIRNSYGRSDQFLLPGGGIRPFESPERAARREIREEVGCTLSGLALVSTHFTSAQGKRDTIYLFKAVSADEPAIDNFEVEEARFFPVKALPPTISPATRRRIEEHIGARSADGSW
jgi:8-oxo-dGTP pyrophosphatase MutT (NUDIX family)